MSGLIAVPAAPVSPPNSMVGADEWFPDVDVDSIRNSVRIGEGIVSHERLVAAIEGAMITVFRQVRDWRTKQVLSGYDNLGDIGDIEINGKTRGVICWERAIRYYVAADLSDDYRDISATDQGTIRADEERLSSDDYRRKGHNAVADLLSIEAETPVARNAVDLI